MVPPSEDAALGWVSKQVLQDLNDVGNWKARAAAVEQLRTALSALPDHQALLPHLPALVGLLLHLVGDINPKMAAAGLGLVARAADLLGASLQPQLAAILPPVMARLADQRPALAAPALAAVQALMEGVGPQQVLDQLPEAARRSGGGATAREQAVNAYILALLHFGPQQLQPPRVTRALVAALGDSDDGVRRAALEALALLAHTHGLGQLPSLLRAAGASEAQVSTALQRAADGELPRLGLDGAVQHVWDQEDAPPRVPGHQARISGGGSAAGAGAGLPAEQPPPMWRHLPPGAAAAGALQQWSLPGVATAGAEAACTPPLRTAISCTDAALVSQVQGSAPGAGAGACLADSASKRWAAGHGHAAAGVPSPQRSASPNIAAPADAHHAAAGVAPAARAAPPARSTGDQQALWGGEAGGGLRQQKSRFCAEDAALMWASGAAAQALDAAHLRERRSSNAAASSTGGVAARALWADCTAGIAADDGVPVRPETFSPNRGERLATLKRLQQEKRAATASAGARSADLAWVWPAAAGDDASGAAAAAGATAGAGAGGSGCGSGSVVWAVEGSGALLQWSLPSKPGSSPAGLRCGGLDSTALPPQQRGLGADPGVSRGSPQDAALTAHQPNARGPGPASGGGGAGGGARGATGRYARNPPAGSLSGGAGDPLEGAGVGTAALRTGSPCPWPLGRADGAATPTGSPKVGAGDRRPLADCGTPSSERQRSGNPTFSSADEVSVADLQPLADPEAALRTSIAKLQQSNHSNRKDLDWMGQCEALNTARAVVKHNPEILRPATLHELVLAAAPAMEALRSTTARAAIALCGELFVALGRGMERELDELVPLLAKKAGEVSTAGRDTFLALEADRALGTMGRCMGEGRAVAALLAVASHKAPAVRAKVAAALAGVVDRGGARVVLAASPAAAERLLRAAAAFLEEGALSARSAGKRIVWELRCALEGRGGEWERALAGVRPESLQRKVAEVVEAGPPPAPAPAPLRTAAGAPRRTSTPGSCGAPPRDACSAGSTPAGSPSAAAGAARPLLLLGTPATPPRGDPAASPVPRAASDPTATPPPPPALSHAPSSPLRRLSAPALALGRAAAPGSPPGAATACVGAAQRRPSAPGGGSGAALAAASPALQATVDGVVSGLAARDWRARCAALATVEGSLAATLPALPDGLLAALLEALAPRLGDANSKVALRALEVLTRVLPSAGDRAMLAASTLVPALAAAVGSANERVRAHATAALDALVACVDPAALAPALAHALQFAGGGARGARGALAERLAALVPALSRARPALLGKCVLPAAMALVADPRAGGDLRCAQGSLLLALVQPMGQALLEHVGGLGGAMQQRVRDALYAAQCGG